MKLTAITFNLSVIRGRKVQIVYADIIADGIV